MRIIISNKLICFTVGCLGNTIEHICLIGDALYDMVGNSYIDFVECHEGNFIVKNLLVMLSDAFMTEWLKAA